MPLPADNNVRVTLPTSDEVIKQLADAGVKTVDYEYGLWLSLGVRYKSKHCDVAT